MVDTQSSLKSVAMSPISTLLWAAQNVAKGRGAKGIAEQRTK